MVTLPRVYYLGEFSAIKPEVLIALAMSYGEILRSCDNDTALLHRLSLAQLT